MKRVDEFMQRGRDHLAKVSPAAVAAFNELCANEHEFLHQDGAATLLVDLERARMDADRKSVEESSRLLQGLLPVAFAPLMQALGDVVKNKITVSGTADKAYYAERATVLLDIIEEECLSDEEFVSLTASIQQHTTPKQRYEALVPIANRLIPDAPRSKRVLNEVLAEARKIAEKSEKSEKYQALAAALKKLDKHVERCAALRAKRDAAPPAPVVG